MASKVQQISWGGSPAAARWCPNSCEIGRRSFSVGHGDGQGSGRDVLGRRLVRQGRNRRQVVHAGDGQDEAVRRRRSRRVSHRHDDGRRAVGICRWRQLNRSAGAGSPEHNSCVRNDRLVRRGGRHDQTGGGIVDVIHGEGTGAPRSKAQIAQRPASSGRARPSITRIGGSQSSSSLSGPR